MNRRAEGDTPAPEPHDLGARFVCAYCGSKMIQPYRSCCGEVHWIPDESEE